MTAKLAATALADIKTDQVLADFTYAQGRSSFRENCGPCHGAGGGGAKGYPNLNDNDWLWGGTLEQIQQTIEFGVRSGHPKAHESQMPAFGKDGMLKPNQIVTVANYLRALANLPTRPGTDLAAGKRIYADNCAICHGPEGSGNKELGAPNLTDGISLFGSDEATIIELIANSRSGVMPAWAGRLDPMTIKALTFYVHSLGGGEK
jgi:cytochrome c oxidase cbb3-type subunit III